MPFAWSQLRNWADEATELGPEETPMAGQVAKRLLSWAQSYYYDEATLSSPDTASALPLGNVGDHALLFHTQVAAWSEGRKFPGNSRPGNSRPGLVFRAES